MRQDIKDTLSRLRYERDRFKAMSTGQRKAAAEARQARRWLDVLHAMDRCHEYAASARQWQSEIDRLKQSYAAPK